MPFLPRRRRNFAVVTTLALFQAGVVRGIDINYCSEENTGAYFAPNNYDLQSLGHCRDICSGYAFAIAQARDCWCSNYAPSTSIDDSSCNLQCPGYPYEVCGSSSGAYSYIEIGLPSGTGGVIPTSNAYSSPSPVFASQQEPETDTIFQTRTALIVQTTAVVQTHVVTQKLSSTSSSTRLSSQRPYTSVEVITVSGAVQTSFITSVPTGNNAASEGSSANVSAKSSGLSNGAVAGITVGVIAAAAVAGLLLFFCCWRRRKDDSGGTRGINRNPSLLSKVGLLRHGSTTGGLRGLAAAGGGAAAVGGVATQAPRLETDIPAVASGPSSAAGSGPMLERRDSRPLFKDQRLNPNALMVHSDTSRTSVGTLQDEQDYSRPLEVRNPDPH